MAEEPPAILELSGVGRERALPVILASFEGYYRWHAKRTLFDVSRVRAATREGAVVGVALLEQLAPGVGYVFYLAVAPEHRRHGIASQLLDDALEGFRSAGDEVAYAAVEGHNLPSLRLFGSRGFRPVGRGEPDYRLGGLGASGLLRRMRVVWGEQLLGLRLGPGRPAAPVREPTGQPPSG